MKLKSIKLPDSETFICSSKELKKVFSNVEDMFISLGHIQKKISFDSRCTHKPILIGKVVSSLGVSRNLSAILNLYPIKADEYSKKLSDEFVEKIIPQLYMWLENQISKSDTAILGYEQMIIELTQKKYKIHNLKFL